MPVILLVEDSPTDAELTRKALLRSRPDAEIHQVKDGAEALSYLRREAAYQQFPWPDLILVDLNMPRMDGREMIRIVRQDPTLAAVPIVVLTTSADERDVSSAYAAGSNAYIVKPVDLTKFFAVVREIDRFWFESARLPAAPSRG
jgi:chemotaxis family two-component system response regulator Rcp1